MVGGGRAGELFGPPVGQVLMKMMLYCGVAALGVACQPCRASYSVLWPSVCYYYNVAKKHYNVYALFLPEHICMLLITHATKQTIVE